MDDRKARRRALAAELRALVLEREQISFGQRVVVFAYDNPTGEAEIRYQGIFVRFSDEPEGRSIVLAPVPDDPSTFSQRLATSNLMSKDASGMWLPAQIVEQRNYVNAAELRVILLDEAFLIADGDAYAAHHARQGIATQWRRPQ